MVRGIDSFREWFRGHEDQYVIIGGTACDLLMTSEGLDFRATKDIDMVLIVEAVDADFGRRFWEYVIQAGYEHRSKSTNEPQFYRFTNPASKEYPTMIELFSRRQDMIALPDDAVLTPLPVDEDISSLSAILLDDDYYDFLTNGTVRIAGITILDALHMIPFKAKAWIDLTERKSKGESIDSRSIRKHKNDVFRLTELINIENVEISYLPEVVKADMSAFIESMASEDIDLKQLGIRDKGKDEILEELRHIYA